MLTGIDAANLCRIEQGKQSAGIDVLSKSLMQWDIK